MDVQTAATLADLRQQLDAARADNARLNSEVSAIGTRLSMDREEIDALTTLLAQARKDNEFLRGFINNPDLKELRDALAASQAREAAYRADAVRLTAEREERVEFVERLMAENRRFYNDMTRERSRADVLAAEVKAWRHWNIENAKVGGDDEVDANANAAWGLLECCQRDTDSTNALDPAKFEVKP